MSQVLQGSRPPGRPRSPEADTAILRATLELLAEVGYATLSMEQVRVRAGVGKATIYRRYSSLDELVKTAINHLSYEPAVPDTGSLRGDLDALAAASFANDERTGNGELWLRLLAEAASEPELNAICYARLVEPGREALRRVFDQAIVRGELRPDVDVEVAIDLLVGAQVYRLLVGGPDRDGAALHTLLRGIAA